MEKFIFDLDGTLLNGDFRLKDYYLRKYMPKKEFEYFLENHSNIIYNYEDIHDRYDIELLTKHISDEVGFELDISLIKGWINEIVDDQIINGVKEVLEYLKSKNKKIVLLTNWFLDEQIVRLKNKKLYQYFDEFYGGEEFIKPNRKAFIKACGNTDKSKCIMIGDNYEKDYLGAKSAGINALHYTNIEIVEKGKIKSLRRITELY